MATKKQKQELIDALKFTPCTYQLTLSGYGGECYAGVVDRKIYEYFKSKKIDINQYAWNWDDGYWKDIPDEMRPFEPGSPYDCDNLYHASGAELSDLNYITVTDEKGETHWEKTLGYSELDDAGVTVECFSKVDFGEQDEGTVIFWGGSGEKGCFFEGDIELTAPFDPAKLKILYEECDGWAIINYVEYDGEDIDGSNGYSTTGKWSEAKWVIVGDEEVYEGVERDEDYDAEAASEDWDPAAELDKITEQYEESSFAKLARELAEASNQGWNDVSEKPPAKGTYECKFAVGKWPLGDVREAEWTGRSWKENGKKAPEILSWREVGEE